MKLTLQRDPSTNECTLGKLSIDGKYFCETLEDIVRPDGVKIFGETAIPAGIYEVQLTNSPRFGKVLPLLINVKNYSGIRIHPGNRASNTEGCILVGESRGENYIYQSQKAFNNLMSRLRLAISKGEKITIEVLQA